MITFTIPSIPVAQPRQRTRVLSVGGRTFAQNYTPTKSPVNVFKAACQAEASKVIQAPISGPVHLWLTFVFPRPKSLTKKRGPNPRAWKPSKPDIDNVYKSLADALTGIAWVDDSQVVWLNVQKLVASDSEQSRVEVRIEAVESPTIA